MRSRLTLLAASFVAACCSTTAARSPSNETGAVDLRSSAPEPEGAGPSAPYDLEPVAEICSEVCRGVPTKLLVAVLQSRAREARRCYERVLYADAGVEGRVELRLTIGADGSVCRSHFARNELGNVPDLLECVRGLVSGEPLPPPSAGCAEVALPLRFRVEEPD